MIGNLFSLLLVLGLVVLFGWLAYRALRARKVWVKIVGGLVAGLLALVFLGVAIMGGKGTAVIYSPSAPPAPELTVARTPEQIARGEYLVTMSCIGCHGAVDAEGNPSGELPLTGGWNIAAAEGFGFVGDMVTENLTPGGKLAGYSDGELFRVLRHGINQEGDLLGFMPLLPYGQLSDDDTEAIIAYLRTQPPVAQPATTGDKLTFVGAVLYGTGMFGTPENHPDHQSAPAEGITAEYGKYVATFGECRGCHGPDVTGTEASPAGPAVPNPRPLVNTLSQEQFFEMMHSGIKPDGTTFPETMPWQNADKMTDDDLAALYVYLTTSP
ncbi:MAG: c-type cytochrome [Chloroflexi bacterium]|nr:c-type cytochrome [Chloroflexota bacterium]MBP7044289.1 c-type cytochrome [Chloroflexota bacterium]